MSHELKRTISAAKSLLPLPDLLRKLGFNPPARGEGNMPSPFSAGRVQKTPSFSIFQRNGAWGWYDRTGGQETKGDEISLLEKLECLSCADAIRRYLTIAGVEVAPGAHYERKEGLPEPAKALPGTHGTNAVAFDWAGCVSKFTADHITQLAKRRGFSPEFVEWLRTNRLVGLWDGSFAFPVHDTSGRVIAAHVRPKTGTRWFYMPRGAGCYPLLIGDLLKAVKTMVFESQWDAFAVMDAMGWHKAVSEGWLVLITRGAGNGRFAARALGAVYAWPQNDAEKEGKRAGEEWLLDVTANAPGPVYRVSTPPNYKDANDWTSAEKIDVSASIGAAVPLEKPAKFKPAESAEKPVMQNGNGSHPAEPPFDPAAVLDRMGLYWLNGASSYFLKREDSGRVRFLEMGAAEIRRKLRVRGFRGRPDPDAGESVSEIDRILDAATESRAVDYVANIAGMNAGVYEIAGSNVLVRESPRLIEPEPGDYRNIEDFLTALLGEEAIYFCCWLKLAFEALRAGERRQGQALILIGPPDCGKSRIQHQIITPILAGRSADPKSFFFDRTDFNAELIGAEHLVIEEIPSSNRHEERQYFGEKIKEVVANDTARLHKKNKDAVTVSPFWRLSVSLNDNPEKLRCLPPLTDDLIEKIILLKVKPAPEFWSRFADAIDPRKDFRETIARELPAFAHYLLTMPIPAHLQGRRYGVKSYIPKDIADLLFESEPEHHLLLLIDKCLFPKDRLEGKSWEGDAEDLKQALCSEASPVRSSAIRLLGAQATACGQYLARLKVKFPTRVERPTRKANCRPWRINPPAD